MRAGWMIAAAAALVSTAPASASYTISFDKPGSETAANGVQAFGYAAVPAGTPGNRGGDAVVPNALIAFREAATGRTVNIQPISITLSLFGDQAAGPLGVAGYAFYPLVPTSTFQTDTFYLNAGPPQTFSFKGIEAAHFFNFSQQSFRPVLIHSIEIGETFTGAPEPASWAMMIGGFGLVGGVVRRRGACRPMLS